MRLWQSSWNIPAVSNCHHHLPTGRGVFSIISTHLLTAVKSTVWQVLFKKFRPLALTWTRVSPHVRKLRCSRTLIKEPSIIFSSRSHFSLFVTDLRVSFYPWLISEQSSISHVWSGSEDTPSIKPESGEITVKDQSLYSPVAVTTESKTLVLLLLVQTVLVREQNECIRRSAPWVTRSKLVDLSCCV